MLDGYDAMMEDGTERPPPEELELYRTKCLAGAIARMLWQIGGGGAGKHNNNNILVAL